jgi:hypothetical protein
MDNLEDFDERETEQERNVINEFRCEQPEDLLTHSKRDGSASYSVDASLIS